MVKANRLRGIDLHPTYGIVIFSLLHGLIVGLFAQFDLYLSALLAPMTIPIGLRSELGIVNATAWGFNLADTASDVAPFSGWSRLLGR